MKPRRRKVSAVDSGPTGRALVQGLWGRAHSLEGRGRPGRHRHDGTGARAHCLLTQPEASRQGERGRRETRKERREERREEEGKGEKNTAP